jgi:hypothetical protein
MERFKKAATEPSIRTAAEPGKLIALMVSEKKE